MLVDRLPVVLGTVFLGLLASFGGRLEGRTGDGRAGALAAPDGRSDARIPLVLEGVVLDLDGAPAGGARIASSAGGETRVTPTGTYRLEVDVPRGATAVEVTAVGGAGGERTATTRVELSPGGATSEVAPLVLERENDCVARWLPTFGGEPGTNDRVFALTVANEGSGPILYTAGDFSTAGGAPARRVAAWDGTRWSVVGGDIVGTVSALAVYDDGSGPALYIGGDFTAEGGTVAYVARWSEDRWLSLGSGTNGEVHTMAVFDDGTGPELFVGGGFRVAGDELANHVAKWDGTRWKDLAGGLTGAFGDGVFSLAVFDDGDGPALYAGGNLTQAGGLTVNRIARWDGVHWSALGSGVNSTVQALAVYDDGSGQALYAGGNFTTAGGVSAYRVAKWDGNAWAGLATGVGHSIYDSVSCLTVYDDGTGSALFVGGSLDDADGTPVSNLAKWDGSTWSDPNGGTDSWITALAVYDDGSGPELVAGGAFSEAGGAPAEHVAAWDGAVWTTYGAGLNDWVETLFVFDDGSGDSLFAGGRFTTAGGLEANRIARWDGSSWSLLGNGLGTSPVTVVYALGSFDDGGGPQLHAAGSSVQTNYNGIAQWTGSSWIRPGGGAIGHVHDLVVWDDGSGPALFVGGRISKAGNLFVERIAKWNGSIWQALGTGVSDYGVRDMEVFDDGGGPALWVAGSFTTAGGLPTNGIAKWDGASWTVPASQLGVGGPSLIVYALETFDDGTGPALYAAGSFSEAGGQVVNNVARWDGASWSALDVGVNRSAHSLAVFDDGTGPALYVGGSFTTAGGLAVNRIARWDGSRWSALGSGTSSAVYSMAVFDDGGGPALCAGGTFSAALGSRDSYLARWGCPRQPLDPVRRRAPETR